LDFAGQRPETGGAAKNKDAARELEFAGEAVDQVLVAVGAGQSVPGRPGVDAEEEKFLLGEME